MNDMLKKRMLINAEYDETRIAIVENQRLESFSFEKIEQYRRRDNIYCAVVETIEPSLQAAFINYGSRRHGFLAIDDVNFAVLGILPESQEQAAKLQIQNVLKIGQKILVQGLRDEIGNKCASFSMNLKLRGRFMIFMPHQRNGGVSKKVNDPKEYERLKLFVDGLKNSHQDSAAIIRSVSEGRSLSDLKKDFISLQGQYQTIWKQFTKARGGSLIQQEASPAVRILREDFSEDIAEVCVDHPETFQEVQYFFKQHLPKYQKNIKLYLGSRSIFTEYGIERQVEALQSNRVALPSGGGIVIDQTEALVAIDVNSGSALQEGSVEDTATRTNLEAVEEVAKQLRLRNLGGLVVVDFIDMNSPNNRKQIVDAMRLATQQDRAQIKLSTLSKFGLLEMSRQRIDSSVVQNVQGKCSACRGTGLQPTIETTANDILRKAREVAALDHIVKMRISLDYTLANHLFNHKRSHLDEIEVMSGVSIHWEIKTTEALNEQTIFEYLRTGQTKYKQFVFRDKPLPDLPKVEKSESDDIQKKLPEEQVKKTPYLKVVSDQTEVPKKNIQDEQATPKDILHVLPTPKAKVEQTTQRAIENDDEKTKEAKPNKLFSSVHRSYPDDAVPLPEVIKKEKPWQDIPIFTTIYRSKHQENENIQAPLIEAIDDEEALAKPKKKKVISAKAEADPSEKKTTSKKKKVENSDNEPESFFEDLATVDNLDVDEKTDLPEKKTTSKKKKVEISNNEPESFFEDLATVDDLDIDKKEVVAKPKKKPAAKKKKVEDFNLKSETLKFEDLATVDDLDKEVVAKPKKKKVVSAKAKADPVKKKTTAEKKKAENYDEEFESFFEDLSVPDLDIPEKAVVASPLIEAIDDEEALAKPKKKKVAVVKKEKDPKKKTTSKKKKVEDSDKDQP